MCTFDEDERFCKYSDCDSFSLTDIWRREWKLTKEQAEHALKVFEDDCLARLAADYNMFTSEQRAAHPDFEKLWEQSKDKWSSAGREWELMPDGAAKWKSSPKPEGVPEYLQPFWAFAVSYGMSVAKTELAALGDTPPEEALTGVYAAIKPYLKGILPSFFHHCTSSGLLRCHFFFELNDVTKQWIEDVEYGNDLWGGPQDYALYKDGYIRLSTCTHEILYWDMTGQHRTIK